MAKRIINGKAVLYTESGAKVLDAEVLGRFNANCDVTEIRFDKPSEKYVLIGGAALEQPPPKYFRLHLYPDDVEQMLNYTRTKFFRLMLDLARLAQFDPINSSNAFFETNQWFHDGRNLQINKSGINWSASVEDLDAQFYRKYKFTPAMIQFVEEKYSYDVI